MLTAVHNGAAHLAETIANTQAQSFTDWEYVVVDDASTDQTTQVVERFMASDSRIRLVRRTFRAGPYVAANDGLKESRGQ